jgi:hypothetical protein
MICDWKAPAPAPQIRENAIATFPAKGFNPLPEQAIEIHVGLLRVFSWLPWSRQRPDRRHRAPIEMQRISFGLQAELDGCGRNSA